MIEPPAPVDASSRADGLALSPRDVGAPNELRALVALTWFPFIAMMRNIATFAFGFLFPVVFISVFGLIGGGGGGPRLGIPADVPRGPAYEALESYPAITLISGDRAQRERALARLVVALLQTAVILALGVFAFGFQLANGLVTFAGMVGMSALGLIVFLGFGLLIAGQARDENGASPLTNLITLPQFLLSGVFFPTDVFPSWVRVIADVLPLTYFNSAMRQIATDGAGFGDILPALIGLCAWGVASYVLAARTFKWV